ncbi:MAG TPA: hypothetical protein VI750_00830, partial [Pyrinomonadaceae bacterium]|nr:hypothetical protein [Pyrinomonadaceae bacterium]
MGIDALTRSDAGDLRIPSASQDWQDWVSATATRNFVLQDPLLDWLDLYGENNGFQRDSDLAGYDPRTDFTKFLFEKTREFEAAVTAYLKTLTTVITIATNPGDARTLQKAEETFAAMEQGATVIYQGVLWDAENRTYGVPDFLIRSDDLLRLFPGSLTSEEAAQPAKDLKAARWHYRVVDLKFTTLDLLAGGELGNGESNPAYKAQLFVYNRALGRVQSYLPPVSYLMGRGWKQTRQSVTNRGDSCMDVLAPIIQNSTLKKGTSLALAVSQATDWLRRVRNSGAKWTVLPNPSGPELRPNMNNREDSPWSQSKKQIAEQLEELTLLWQVGADKRRDANNLGIYRWRDPNCTAASVGVTGPKMQPTLQAILSINQTAVGPAVAPPRVQAAEQVWRKESALEFYVDFETVSDLNDDFSLIPKRGGQPMIFMVGCGHMENGAWQFRCFTTDALTETSEAAVIDAWIDHMKEVRDRVASKIEPLVIHWSKAEISSLETAYNSAMQRHGNVGKGWVSPNWFDFLKEVIKAEPVVIRGALGFGLKDI